MRLSLKEITGVRVFQNFKQFFDSAILFCSDMKYFVCNCTKVDCNMNTFISQQGRKTDRETDIYNESYKLQSVINV